MKDWHVIVLVVVVIATGAATVLCVQSKMDDVVLCIQTTSSDHEQAIDQRLRNLEASVDQHSQALQKSLSGSVSATASKTEETLNGRLKELSTSVADLNTSVAEKTENASSKTSAELARRLDALEKSIVAELAAITPPPPAEAPATPAGPTTAARSATSTRTSRPSRTHPRTAVDISTVDLAGKWEISLPCGLNSAINQNQPSIIAMGNGQYRFFKMGVFGGVYEAKGDRLVVVEPDDKRLTEFVWRLQDADNLVLIQSSTTTGADYTGAKLKRVQ